MSAYDSYTNYKDNAGVSSVVFGAKKPLLEVELNEMQEIQKTYMRNVLRSIIGDGITDLSSIKYTDGKLNISDCIFSVNGIIVQCDTLTLDITDGSAYIQVWEEDVDFKDTLNKYGNQQSSETIENWIKDPRSLVDTTKRKVVKYTLTGTLDPTKHNLKIADFTDSVMTLVLKEVDISKAIKELQSQITVLKGNIENVENSKVDKPTQKTLVIPNNGWIDEVNGNYLKKLVLPVEGITENMIVTVNISLESDEVAVDCGLSSINDSGDGTLTFYAESVPSSPLNATYFTILATD